MKKNGFTLAEIILAMTLIGALAAMTLPNLDYRFKKSEYSTKIKKFYSKMDSAFSEMETDEGSAKDLQKPANSAAAYAWYMQLLDKHMGHQFVDKDNQTVYFKDGASIKITQPSEGDCTEFLYDINSTKRPDVIGKDQFVFLICFTDTSRAQWFGSSDVVWGTYGKDFTAKNTSRDTLKTKCKTDTKFCSRLLELDDWEFKNDYPFKIN